VQRPKKRWTLSLFERLVSKTFIPMVLLFLLLMVASGSTWGVILIVLYMAFMISECNRS
jgi:membrane-bound ClpP family serine protease